MPGIDTVHYQLLKRLPDDSILLLLYIFNHIWLTQDFPTSCKTAIIIPVPKPGKVLSDPGSYRPIVLTSCLCKTMERMVNSRLTWYLGRHMVITEFQSWFRRRISTVDNLVTLVTSIRDAFVGRKHLISIFLFVIILHGNMVFHWIYTKQASVVVYLCLPDLIYYSSSHMPHIERKLQRSHNRLGRWYDENGFMFSPTKTMCVHFVNYGNNS